MFHLVRFLVWLTGVAVFTYFLLSFVGYEVNFEYFTQSKEKCQELLRQCQDDIANQGVNKALDCNYQCVDKDGFNLKDIVRKKTVSE